MVKRKKHIQQLHQGPNSSDFLLLSYIMFLCYYHHNNSNQRVLNNRIHYQKEFQIIYKDFTIHNHSWIKVVRRLYNVDLNKYLNLTPRHQLYRLIKQKRIDAVCNVTRYLSYLRTNQTKSKKTKQVYLYKVLEDFVRLGGAVIIKNRKIHRYMNLKKPGNSWAIVLQDMIFK